MTQKYRKAQVGRDDVVTVKDFPGDDPENDDVLWFKVQRPNGKTFSRLSALQGLLKQDENGTMVLAMSPIDALIELLPDSVVSHNLTDPETGEPITLTAEVLYGMDPGDFQYILNAWSTLIAAGQKVSAVKPEAPKSNITVQEKKGSPVLSVIESEPLEAGEMPKTRLQLVLPLADG